MTDPADLTAPPRTSARAGASASSASRAAGGESLPGAIPYTSDELRIIGLDPTRLPQHIAIIMDGNGRWAQSQGKMRIEGHRQGVYSVRAVVEECARLNIPQLTLYCLSSENWKRPRLEIDLLMSLLRRYVVAEREEIMRQNIRFCTIGREDKLSAKVLQEVHQTIAMSASNTGMKLCLALDYGSRREITDAVREIARGVQNGSLDPEEIDESTVSEHLYTSGMIDPDLVIRTANERRISNFLLWQISYAEIYITEAFWPDFRQEHLREALQDFASRERRFGGLK